MPDFSFEMYARLVAQMHASGRGLHAIESYVEHVPGHEGLKVAVVKATVKTQDGGEFQATSSADKEHGGLTLIEVAERRAKIIALAEATNNTEALAHHGGSVTALDANT